MFWRKQSRKKCHPCLKLAIFTAGLVGAIGLLNKGKCMVKAKMNNMIKFIKNGCKACDTSNEQQ